MSAGEGTPASAAPQGIPADLAVDGEPELATTVLAALQLLAQSTMRGYSSPEAATVALGHVRETARALRNVLHDTRRWLQAEHTQGRLALSADLDDPDGDDLTVFVRASDTTRALSLALSAADLLADTLDRACAASSCLTTASDPSRAPMPLAAGAAARREASIRGNALTTRGG